MVRRRVMSPGREERRVITRAGNRWTPGHHHALLQRLRPPWRQAVSVCSRSSTGSQLESQRSQAGSRAARQGNGRRDAVPPLAVRIPTRTWKEIERPTRSNVGGGPRRKAGCET
jgi:hypothetical protein